MVVDLRSDCLAIATPVVGKMSHIQEVGYRLGFPVKHLVTGEGVTRCVIDIDYWDPYFCF